MISCPMPSSTSCGLHTPRPGRVPVPPFDPKDYWATKRWVVVHMQGTVSELDARINAIGRRIDEIEQRGISDDGFLLIARRVGVAFRSEVPTLAGRSFRLSSNNDLYEALAAVIPALGGTVKAE